MWGSRSRECVQRGDHSTAHKGHKRFPGGSISCRAPVRARCTARCAFRRTRTTAARSTRSPSTSITTRQVTPRERAWAMPAPLRPSLHRRPTLGGRAATSRCSAWYSSRRLRRASWCHNSASSMRSLRPVAPYLCGDRVATVRIACGAWLLLVGCQQGLGRRRGHWWSARSRRRGRTTLTPPRTGP